IRRNDSGGNEIVNLVQADALTFQFLPDGIKSLNTSLDNNERYLRLLHLLFDSRSHAFEKRFVLRSPFLQLFSQLPVVFGMKVAEREVFKLSAQFTHTKAVRDWS